MSVRQVLGGRRRPAVGPALRTALRGLRLAPVAGEWFGARAAAVIGWWLARATEAPPRPAYQDDGLPGRRSASTADGERTATAAGGGDLAG